MFKTERIAWATLWRKPLLSVSLGERKWLLVVFCFSVFGFFFIFRTAAAAKSLQSCLTLCDPIDGNPPGSPIPGILQAKTLEWVAISFSNAWKWKVKVKSLSRFWLFATPWTAAYQAPLSMRFSRQEYWSGVPLHWVIIKSFLWSLPFKLNNPRSSDLSLHCFPALILFWGSPSFLCLSWAIWPKGWSFN